MCSPFFVSAEKGTSFLPLTVCCIKETWPFRPFLLSGFSASHPPTDVWCYIEGNFVLITRSVAREGDGTSSSLSGAPFGGEAPLTQGWLNGVKVPTPSSLCELWLGNWTGGELLPPWKASALGAPVTDLFQITEGHKRKSFAVCVNKGKQGKYPLPLVSHFIRALLIKHASHIDQVDAPKKPHTASGQCWPSPLRICGFWILGHNSTGWGL